MREALSGILLLIGAGFMFVAAIGILRMPDLYTRASATTKAATLGVAATLLAAAVYFGELGITSRALATIAFLLLTAPVAAHMIGRAAYFGGVPLCSETIVDELSGHYDLTTHELESIPLPDLELQLPDLQVFRLRIPDESPVVGKTLAQIDLRREHEVTLLAIRRGSLMLSNPSGDVHLYASDELIVLGSPEKADQVASLLRCAVETVAES
jgi:multicomponent Na+:H+ antiporter subunit G